MKKAKKYESLYRINKSSGNVIINISLDDYREFFHEWDNSVFSQRDLHPELAHFFDLCSEDIPIRKKIEICIYLNTTEINNDKEGAILKSYINYYSSIKRLENRKTRRFIRVSVTLLLVSLKLLSIYSVLIDRQSNTLLSKVLL